MISEVPKSHKKHANISRPSLGSFARNELAILGTPCGNIKQLVQHLVESLNDIGELGFVDADHKAAAYEDHQSLTFTDKISYRRLDYKQDFNSFQLKPLFNSCELVLVNGNHFEAANQIVILDQKKPLERKLARLSNPVLLVKKTPDLEVPDYLLPYVEGLPVLDWEQTESIVKFVRDWVSTRKPSVKGLVLAGGKSVRMKRDKGAIDYHGVSQRQYVHGQLISLGIDSVVSCREDQTETIESGLPVLTDSFQGLGPMGALLTAFKSDPDSAWLAIACDLPYLTKDTIQYLLDHRDHTRIATAFKSPFDEFPEPLITIWEPRSYSVLLNFLSQGYSCPRKALINSKINLVNAPEAKDLSNVNHPEEYQNAVADLRS